MGYGLSDGFMEGKLEGRLVVACLLWGSDLWLHSGFLPIGVILSVLDVLLGCGLSMGWGFPGPDA